MSITPRARRPPVNPSARSPHARRSRWLLPPAAIAAVVLVTSGLGAQRAVPRDPADAPATSGAQRGALPLSVNARRVQMISDASARHLRYLPSEVLVKFRSGVSVAGRSRALSTLRGRPTSNSLRWIGDVAVLTDETQPDARLLADELRAQPEVEYAQPNYIRRQPGWRSGAYRTAVTVTPSPSLAPDDPDYAVLQWNFSLLDMPAAWTINPGGSPSVTVAVIDTGVTTDAGAITFPLWTGQRFEPTSLPFGPSPDITASRFVSPDTEVLLGASAPVIDMVGHGTHVASTVVEDANNGMGLAGMAYNVRLMPVKVCTGYWEVMIGRAMSSVPGFAAPDAGGCSDDAIVAGIRYAVDNGANVLNLSLGGPDTAPAIRDALAYAVAHGVFVAIAMGNDHDDGNPIEYPAAYAPDLDGVMSVGAVGKSQARAYYSSTGDYVEIAAPGGDDAQGGGEDQGYIWQTTLFPPDQDPAEVVRPRFDRYVEVGYEGTSMATPHVAGLAALLMSQGGVKSPKAIEAFIKATAKDLGAPGQDDEFGAGLIQPRAALRGLGIAN
jgi:serine protease